MVLSGLERVMSLFNESERRGSRGGHRNKNTRTKLLEGMPACKERNDGLDGYIRSEKGNLIPLECGHLLNFVQFGKAPPEWRKVFEDDIGIGSAMTATASYTEPHIGS